MNSVYAYQQYDIFVVLLLTTEPRHVCTLRASSLQSSKDPSFNLCCGCKVIFIIIIINAANFQNSMVKTHYLSTHQPSLAARPKLAVMTYQSIHGILPTVVFHLCCRRDIQTTAAVFYLTSSGRSARSSLCSQQAGVSGFLCHRLERPASLVSHLHRHWRFLDNDSRHFCFPFLPRHYHMTRVLLLPFITTVG